MEKEILYEEDLIEISKMLGWNYMEHWNPVPLHLEGFREDFYKKGYLFHLDTNWIMYALTEIKRLGGVWRVSNERDDNQIETLIIFPSDNWFKDFPNYHQNLVESMYGAVLKFAQWYNNEYNRSKKNTF